MERNWLTVETTLHITIVDGLGLIGEAVTKAYHQGLSVNDIYGWPTNFLFGQCISNLIITNLFNESIGSCLPSRTLCTKENFSCSVSCCRGLRTLSCAPSQRSKRWSSWAARWSSRVYKEFLIKLELTDLANHIIYTYYIQYCFSWLAQWCMQSTAGLAQWNLMKVRVQKGCYLG